MSSLRSILALAAALLLPPGIEPTILGAQSAVTQGGASQGGASQGGATWEPPTQDGNAQEGVMHEEATVLPARPSAPRDGHVLSAVLGARRAAAAPDRARAVTSVWGWPLVGQPEVVRPYDPPEQRWLAGHRGIDLAGVAGEPVLAVDAGVVAFSGTVAGVGVVSVDHASGLRSTYQPVTDRVARGERVARGGPLGRLDVTGHCLLVDCLHLGARTGRHTYVDPLPLLRPAELSLLPLGPVHGSR